MMKNSPYLDQDRELDVLLKLVRDYDATSRQFNKLPEVPRGGALLGQSSASRASAKTVMVAEARKAGLSLKRAS